MRGRVAYNPSTVEAKRRDHFLQTDFAGLIHVEAG